MNVILFAARAASGSGAGLKAAIQDIFKTMTPDFGDYWNGFCFAVIPALLVLGLGLLYSYLMTEMLDLFTERPIVGFAVHTIPISIVLFTYFVAADYGITAAFWLEAMLLGALLGIIKTYFM